MSCFADPDKEEKQHDEEDCSSVSSGDTTISDEDEALLPQVPALVDFAFGTFVNAQGLELRTYRWVRLDLTSRGIVVLCHGYASHLCFDWFLPSQPGEPHDMWQGCVVQLLVDAGYTVCGLDYQGMGRSQGARGLKCFFEHFDDLPKDVIAYVEKDVLTIPELKGLPLFAFGISMGGAVAVRIAQIAPKLLRGCVLFAPMLSLEQVKQQPVCGCLRNKHLSPVANFLDRIIPTTPIASGAKNTIHPLAQKEFDEDPIAYHGQVRTRVAKEFDRVCSEFMAGSLKKMKTPFATFHSVKDSFTDPAGSAALVKIAKTDDKKLFEVGPGKDIEEDMWHGLTVEPGREAVLSAALAWVQERTGKSTISPSTR